MLEQSPPLKRIRLSRDELRQLSKEEIISRWCDQDLYITSLEDMVHLSDRPGSGQELASLRNSEAQLKTQLSEVKKRENVMVLKLAAKEQEVNEYRNHIQLLKTSSTPSVTQLKSLLLDPAVNLMFQRMKQEVKDAKKKEKEAQEDLAAWKFTPDSQTGKRLMARCRSLLQENESIGKMIASGRVAKIEGELSLQRRLVQEMKSGQAELDVFIAELDEDVEGMQSTIYLLQQQLREARTQTSQLKAEVEQLKCAEDNAPKQVQTNDIKTETGAWKASRDNFHEEDASVPTIGDEQVNETTMSNSFNNRNHDQTNGDHKSGRNSAMGQHEEDVQTNGTKRPFSPESEGRTWNGANGLKVESDSLPTPAPAKKTRANSGVGGRTRGRRSSEMEEEDEKISKSPRGSRTGAQRPSRGNINNNLLNGEVMENGMECD